MQPSLPMEASCVPGLSVLQGREVLVDIASCLVSVVDLVHNILQLASRWSEAPQPPSGDLRADYLLQNARSATQKRREIEIG